MRRSSVAVVALTAALGPLAVSPRARAAPAWDPAPAVERYEQERRRPSLALLREALVPGLGSLYADHPEGAVVTWGFTLASAGMLVYGLHGGSVNGDVSFERQRRMDYGLLGAGVLFLIGRAYGITDAYRSSIRYNQALRLRLGLEGIGVDF